MQPPPQQADQQPQATEAMYEDYIQLPVIPEEEVDLLTMQLGISDWTIYISPVDLSEYEQDPDTYQITTQPLKEKVKKQIAVKLMENHAINLKDKGRFVKIISPPKSRPPWRAHLRLHTDDSVQDIVKDFTINGLQVPQDTTDYLSFVLDMSPINRASHTTNYIGYMVKWGNHQHATQPMINQMIEDFDSRIPSGFPKVLHRPEEGPVSYTGHWEVNRATTSGYDVRAGMRTKVNDTAMIFLVSKQSLTDHTEGINRNLAAPPYVYMPVIEGNEAKIVKLDVDIMGFGYCKGDRRTHDESKKDSPDDDFSERTSCVYCTREWNEERQRLQNVNRCRNNACRINMGIKAKDPKTYEAFRTSHDCVLAQRQAQGAMLDYALPPIPQLDTKKWNQTTPTESRHMQLNPEIQRDQESRKAAAEHARQMRDATAKAQADHLFNPPQQPRRVTQQHQAKKQKTFGGYQTWPA